MANALHDQRSYSDHKWSPSKTVRILKSIRGLPKAAQKPVIPPTPKPPAPLSVVGVVLCLVGGCVMCCNDRFGRWMTGGVWSIWGNGCCWFEYAELISVSLSMVHGISIKVWIVVIWMAFATGFKVTYAVSKTSNSLCSSVSFEMMAFWSEVMAAVRSSQRESA